ncbi:MAG TPA: branched-chain amino acid ABC transporter substrate-binding protein [Solirubrobacteraceae bacterium]|jgi:ABC-type branched-subunit amino acid transport system substrate-binding protein|nr:branched-chain amino acid ABC transporter substrate-binding protein [Solirubrobacteraceae bacterium]
MRLRNRVLAGGGWVALIAALAGCGATTATTTTITGTTLTIYASVPQNGPESSEGHDVLAAEQLALQQAGGKVGAYKIDLVPLNDATSAGWSPKLIAANARAVIQQANAVAYIGEIDPNASAQSIPITNADDLLQVSPYDTAIGLTLATRAVPNSPDVYYEALSSNGRTFGRVVPNDTYQAKAQLQVMQSLGVKKLFIVEDGEPYGDAIALAVQQYAHAYGITAGVPARTGAGLAQSGDDALFYGGVANPNAVALFDGAAAANPKLKLFGPGGVYTSSFTSQLSPAAQNATYLSEPGLTAAELPPAGKQFITAFKTAYGHVPWTQAIFGYAAMQTVLRALTQAGAKLNVRQADINSFLGAKNISSALGTFSIDKHGDTSLAPYIFSRVKGGKLVAYKGLIVKP